MVCPPRHGTPTLALNWAMTRPASATAVTTSTVPGVTRAGPSRYGPSAADSAISATAEAA